MGLKLLLECYDKKTEMLVSEEYSNDLGEDSSVIKKLGLPIENNINNGGFDVKIEWLGVLQPYFKNKINLNSYDYQVSFDYADEWPDKNKQT